MRAFVDLQVLLTDDAAQRLQLLNEEFFIDDSDPTSISVKSDAFYNLVASASNVQAAYGGVVTTSLVLIVAYNPIQVRLGSTVAPLVSINPVPAAGATALSLAQRAAQPGVLLLRGSVSSIYLTNPSGSASARAFVAVAGMPT